MSTSRGALGAAKALDLMGRRRPPMATCPRDGAPLISTMTFSYAEFYCLECGARLGFLDPAPVEETPELTARYEALRAEWDEHAVPLLLQDREAGLAWLRRRAGG